MNADIDVLAIRLELDVRAGQSKVETQVFDLPVIDADVGERVKVVDAVRLQRSLGVEELLQVLQ